jgi:hypothetical protein
MLAAIVAQHSPLLSSAEKQDVAHLVEGDPDSVSRDRTTIAVSASDIACKVSVVDLTSRTCEIRFGRDQVTLRGQAANELFATMLEAGVPPDPGAGQVWVHLSNLNCVLTLPDLRAKGGAGATCSFEAPSN